MTNERGMATIETIMVMPVFLAIISYSFGCFGAIHTAILHSIAARTYAYETFRHRADLSYLRDNSINSSGTPTSYRAVGARVHGIAIYEGSSVQETFYATERPIAKGFMGPDVEGRTQAVHDDSIPAADMSKATTIQVNPIWVMVQYGICLNAACGS